MDQATAELIDDDSLCVFNKIDKAKEHSYENKNNISPIFISAKKEENLNELIDALVDKINLEEKERDGPYLTRKRHRVYLEHCRGLISDSIHQAVPELKAEDIRQAMRALGRITGHVDVEDILDVIFKDFCIGK